MKKMKMTAQTSFDVLENFKNILTAMGWGDIINSSDVDIKGETYGKYQAIGRTE